MRYNFRKEKRNKLKKAVKLHSLRREDDTLQKIENYRATPCGFNYDAIMKRRHKR